MNKYSTCTHASLPNSALAPAICPHQSLSGPIPSVAPVSRTRACRHSRASSSDGGRQGRDQVRLPHQVGGPVLHVGAGARARAIRLGPSSGSSRSCPRARVCGAWAGDGGERGACVGGLAPAGWRRPAVLCRMSGRGRRVAGGGVFAVGPAGPQQQEGRRPGVGAGALGLGMGMTLRHKLVKVDRLH